VRVRVQVDGDHDVHDVHGSGFDGDMVSVNGVRRIIRTQENVVVLFMSVFLVLVQVVMIMLMLMLMPMIMFFDRSQRQQGGLSVPM
jgi:hypothetical protein